MKKLYFNGTIITMEGAGQVEAVLTENGLIKSVGRFHTLLESALDATLIDLCGKTMMPAFIDTHSHFSAYASSSLQVSLHACTSWDEMEYNIRMFMRNHRIKAGEWVIANGYDHNILAEKRHPNLEWMDACCPKHPLVLQHASGHVGVFNSLALKLLGITPDTHAPEGGYIGHENGALTGYMEENAFFRSLKTIPMPDMKALMGAYAKVQDKYASYGIATIQEGMLVSQMIPLYQYLTAHHMLKLDVVAYADWNDSEQAVEAFPESIGNYNAGFKLGGYKIFLDGSPQGRTAWMRTPYSDCEDGYKGYGTMKQADVRAALEHAVKTDMQILAHCNGDAAAQQLIDCSKDVPKIKRIRPVMIHAQLLGRDQLKEVKTLGILPSFFIAHVYHWGDVHIRTFGLERAARISPAHSALMKDIMFTFHQDAPVIEPNMLETVWCAVNRRTKNGVLLGGDERISVYEAFKAITVNAAYQYFEESQKGSIAPGKHADFVLLDRNPLDIPPEELRNIKVQQTIKKDVVIYLRS